MQKRTENELRHHKYVMFLQQHSMLLDARAVKGLLKEPGKSQQGKNDDDDDNVLTDCLTTRLVAMNHLRAFVKIPWSKQGKKEELQVRLMKAIRFLTVPCTHASAEYAQTYPEFWAKYWNGPK